MKLTVEIDCTPGGGKAVFWPSKCGANAGRDDDKIGKKDVGGDGPF
jgi:hypothetical protein